MKVSTTIKNIVNMKRFTNAQRRTTTHKLIFDI